MNKKIRLEKIVVFRDCRKIGDSLIFAPGVLTFPKKYDILPVGKRRFAPAGLISALPRVDNLGDFFILFSVNISGVM